MANPGIDLSDVTSENLALYLVDIRLPVPVGWWPLAPGWWVLAISVLIAAAWWMWRQKPSNRRSALPSVTDKLFQKLQADGDTAAYCHQMSLLLRQAALGGEDRKSVACLHGQQWVRWMEISVGCTFSAEVRNLLSDECYRASPLKASPSVHQELVTWLDLYRDHTSDSQKVVKRA